MTIDPRTLRDLAVEVVESAGAALRDRALPTTIATKSSARDLVSEADRTSEQRITEALSEARPDDAILGEEGTARPGTSGVRWVVDPLDGTTNYLYGLPSWSVSIAAETEDDGAHRTLAAAVHQPTTGETFAAARGCGASQGSAPLRANDPVPLGEALVCTGFAYGTEVRSRQAAQLVAVLPRVRDLRRDGSAALELCWVAAGRLDGFYEDDLGRWDWLAGALIAQEAGAVVTPLREGVVAAGPALHAELTAALAAAEA
ncbi:inositol monophosphatase [Egibacter rhizosphaerae]|uniref:Inositol-1-monophosphatase n=1 Tax=Egibacter rhizosphaerae TaxID=1670831 RepID=A0A411YBT7_9ACTN|nr:inositol monophosphatase family protein [Egibacter rhizosphaerae]QBI18645.1 inositol monophosphatase [Egibacter rhizosphaerae]